MPAEARPVPQGIKGARFGMRPAELLRALPGLVDVEEQEAETAVYDGASVNLPGKRLRARTTIGPREARCVFAFTLGERLTRIDCTVDTGKQRKVYEATWPAILQALRAKYGQANATSSPYRCEKGDDTYLKREECNGLWVWADRGARLEVTASWSEFAGMGGSGITIVNRSPEHARAEAQATREAKQRVRQRNEAQRKKAATLLRHSRPYDKDL